MARRRKNKATSSTTAKRRFRPTISLSWIRFPSFSGHFIRRCAIALAWIAMLSGLTAAWMMCVPGLQTFASQQHAIDPNNVTIRFVNAPEWLNGDLGNSLMRTAQANIGSNPMASNDLVAIRKSLLRTGWFDDVYQVRRADDDVIEISANYVRACALIRDKDGCHLIDATGKLLPRSYRPTEPLPTFRNRSTNAEYHAVVITGARFKRPQQPGIQWEGTDIAAGVRLLGLIDRQPWRNQVAQIDVSGYLNDGPIKIRTDKGCSIVWGGAPGEEPALEVLAAGKVARLKYLFERHGRIDANQSAELDITGEKAIVMR